MLSPREVTILRRMADPTAGSLKEIAFSLGLSHGTLKVYQSHIYRKLQWEQGDPRRLALWAIAHRDKLGITLPTPEQFSAPRPV